MNQITVRQLVKYQGQSPSLKSNKNATNISLIVSPNDNLNSKADKVNIQLINMCGELGIIFIDHLVSLSLNESNLHLNKPGKIEFTKNVWIFIVVALICSQW